jgi:hypothetical protein
MDSATTRRVLLSIVTTVFFFGCAELWARTVNSVFPRWGLPDTTSVIMTAHPTRMWGLSPGKRRNVNTTATINALGLRGAIPTMPRPDNEERIVILGDSSFFGHGVSDDTTMDRVLEDILPNSRVINAGIPGYSTEQTKRLLDEVIWDLDPTLLVVGNFWSDNNFESYRDKDLFATREVQTSAILVQSAFLRWLATALSGLRTDNEARIVTWVRGGELPKADHRRVELPDYMSNLDSIIRSAASRDVGVLLISPPAKVEVEAVHDPPHQWGVYRERQREVAKHHGIPHVDATLRFYEAHRTHPSPKAAALYIDDMHPTVHGHAMMADIIASALTEAGWPGARLQGTGTEAFDVSDVVDTTPISRRVFRRPGDQSPLQTMFMNDGESSAPQRKHPALVRPIQVHLQATTGTGPFQIEVRAKDRIMASVRAKAAGTFSLKVPAEALPATITARNAAGAETRQDITDLSQPVTLSLP